MVTLDGLQYTFNGRGEFILAETNDGSFMMQGRMIQALSTGGNPTRGTVYSAIVAKQNDSDTVQIEVRSRALRARVNGEIVSFAGVQGGLPFNNVTLHDEGNDTISAQFSNGATITVTAELGIISVIYFSLPSSLQNITSGLLGNFNGDPSDDLLPRGGGTPLPTSSSLQEIHEMFGITCEYL